MTLDLESVRLFVLAADLGNLTRAAEAAGTVQPVVSQRIKSLEEVLGRKLLERTPRYVRLTPGGTLFLERARALLQAHDAAITLDDAPIPRISIALSDHAVGVSVAPILSRLRVALPAKSVINIRLDLSQSIREAFDAGELDAAVIRREGHGADGELLGTDPLGWRAAADWTPSVDGTLPLAVLRPPCGVRAVAIRTLENANTRWREAFVGGSCAVLLAAVQAGVGVAAMGRLASGGTPDRGPDLGLPPLPDSQIVLLARAGSAHAAQAIRILAAGIRAMLST
jgi:DNA-binding transcriptional LysR family regulator